MVKIVAKINNNIPSVVNESFKNPGFSSFDLILEPTFDHSSIAIIPPDVVIVEIVIIPKIPPPKSVSSLDIIMNTNIHSFPFTYCIKTPVLKPIFGIVSGNSKTRFDWPSTIIAIAIKNIKIEPIMLRISPTVLSWSKESTANPQIKCIEMKPKAIPAING